MSIQAFLEITHRLSPHRGLGSYISDLVELWSSNLLV